MKTNDSLDSYSFDMNFFLNSNLFYFFDILKTEINTLTLINLRVSIFENILIKNISFC